MPNRLLDRQASLLEHLTSTAMLFGEDVDAPVDHALQGIDRGLLRLEARFCCNRRIKRIIAVFPRTFEIIRADQQRILREFVESNRQTDINTLANALEFYEFLLAHSQSEPPTPPYLLDVAACELAIAKVCNIVAESDKSLKISETDRETNVIRRCRDVVLLRCSYDIRSIFEADLREVIPSQRDISLAIAWRDASGNASILEMPSVAFELLVRLEDWADPRTLADIDDVDSLVSHLVAQKLIEVRA
jgi:hypothetical protein